MTSSDQWTATDALDRTLPGIVETGAVKQGKFIAMFYWTWHQSGNKNQEPHNLTELLARYDEATLDANQTHTIKARLTEGEKTPLKIEYANKTGDGIIKLEWESESQLKEVIPRSQLFPKNMNTAVNENEYAYPLGLASAIAILSLAFSSCTTETVDQFEKAFKDPPDTSNPGVYWYFMDGNLSMEEMTKDLESMKESGINHVIFL